MPKMPVLFVGHGSPMLALEENVMTKNLKTMGDLVCAKFGKPKAILALSAHWYTRGTFIQSEARPRQIYDMYGFPQELYQVLYPVKGCMDLTQAVKRVLGKDVCVNDDWGIDHGIWTVLVHMFRDASIPVVQLSIDATITPKEAYEMGVKLKTLRKEGYLILGSGNIVHNLRAIEWDNPSGSEKAKRFNERIVRAVKARDIDTLLHFDRLEDAGYATGTPDHFLPLLYCLGASGNDAVMVFNEGFQMGSIASTSFGFGLEE